MTTSKKFKAGENFTRAADAPPDAHALITTLRERPVQFLDIGRNNDAAHVALVNRAAQLEQIKNKRGDLSADEQEEQARIHHLLRFGFGERLGQAGNLALDSFVFRVFRGLMLPEFVAQTFVVF